MLMPASYISRCIQNEILMFLRKAKLYTETSFDEIISTDDDGNGQALYDVLSSDENSIEKSIENDIDKQILLRTIKKLTEKEQKIICMRFGLNETEEYTQKEVADILGVSQSYISKLEKRIYSRMRHEIAMST